MDEKRPKNKRKTFLIIVILLIIIIGAIVFIEIKQNGMTNYNNIDNSLIGSFLYEEDGTIYEFKKNGKGSMTCGDITYKFSYTVQDGNLIIDYNEEKIQDVKYSYSFQNNDLKLVSLEGTASIGEEYKLIRENK